MVTTYTRIALLCLISLAAWGQRTVPRSSIPYATSTLTGGVRLYNGLDQTGSGYALDANAGKLLKALVDANTSVLASLTTNVSSTTDTQNTSMTALYIAPNQDGQRLFFGKPGRGFYAINWSGVQGWESVPAFRFANGGLQLGIDTDGAITRIGNRMTFNASSNGAGSDQGFEWYGSSAGYTSIAGGAPLLAKLTTGGNFGIGIGTPTAKLHVVGNATVTGTLAVTGLTVNGAAITGANSGDQTLSLNGQQLTISGANGNTVTLPASGTAVSQVTSVSTLAGLAAATTPQAIFDGSVWTRVSGNVNTDPGTNNLYTATQYNAGSDRYERQFLGRAKFEWWRFSSGNTWEQMKYAAGARIPVQFANGDYYTNERSYITPNTQFYGNSNTPDSVRIHITGPNPFWLMSWFWFDGTPGKRAEGIIIDGFSIYNESTFVANKDQNDFYGPISIDGGGARNIVIRNMNYKQVSSTAIVNAILVKMGTNKDGDGVLIDNVRSLSSTVAGRMLVEILNQGDGYSSSNPERTQIPARNVVIRNCIADNFRFGLSVAGNFVGAYIHNNIVRNCTDYGIEVAGPQPGVRVERNGFGGSHNVLIAGNAEGSVTADYMAAGQGQYYRDNYTEGTLTGTGGIIEIRGGGDMVFSGNKLRIGGGIFLRRTSAGGVLSADFSDNVIVSSATATNMTNKALLYIAGATNIRGFGNTFIRTSTDTQPYVQAATSTATSGYTATGVNSTGSLFFNNMFLGTTVPTSYFSATSPNSLTSINNINQNGVITN